MFAMRTMLCVYEQTKEERLLFGARDAARILGSWTYLWNIPCREETYIDDIVQKSHIERTLLSSLGGVRTVFDGGAGCGRFSILLAKQGCEVTHFDISQPMLDKAQELAEKAGVLDRMTFVKGALEDLSAFQDRSFDLVISFDAPISYTYPKQEQVLRELVRICRKRLVLSVSDRKSVV